MSATPSYESGLRNHRIEFVRETTSGETPTDPEWSLYSDVVRTLEPAVDTGAESQYSLGTPDSVGVFVGTETDELTVTYDMQQKDSDGNILFDGSGNPIDAATDGLTRDEDNRVRNTHTIVVRQDHSNIDSDNAKGDTSRDTRRYLVVKGGFVDEVTLTGDPSDAQPVLNELAYQCEKIRTYQIDQPTDGGTLVEAVSTDSSDSSQTLTIEGVDDSDTETTEDIELDGDTVVVGTTTFTEIDAVELDSQTVGDVSVQVESGGDVLAEIRGQSAFDHGEGDLGVPVTNEGTHADDIAEEFETYHDDTIHRPDGTNVADGFETTEFAVANNIDPTNQGSTPRPAISAGIREVTVDVTVFGETAHHDMLLDQVVADTQNVRWNLNASDEFIQADNADPREVSATIEVEESKMMTDVSFTGQGLTVSNQS